MNINNPQYDNYEFSMTREVFNNFTTSTPIKTVLLATTLEGQKSKDALEWAVKFSDSLGAELEIVHVIKPGSVWKILFHLSSVEDSIIEEYANAKDKMNEIIHSLLGESKEMHTHILCTDRDGVGDKILIISKQAHADLIICESHDKAKYSKTLNKVMDENNVPLLIVGKNINSYGGLS